MELKDVNIIQGQASAFQDLRCTVCWPERGGGNYTKENRTFLLCELFSQILGKIFSKNYICDSYKSLKLK